MKPLSRSYVWWPKLDADIESKVRACAVCERVRATPTKLPLHPRIYPKHPFQKVHIYFCEDKQQHFLILVDSCSKWAEVKPMQKTTADKTLGELRLIFAQHRLPEQLASDNGTQFIAHEFKEFMIQNGIKQLLEVSGWWISEYYESYVISIKADHNPYGKFPEIQVSLGYEPYILGYPVVSSIHCTIAAQELNIP